MELKETHKAQNQIQEAPLFTGNYLHDSSVSEYEKAAEVAEFISDTIKKRKTKRKSKCEKLSREG